MQILIIGSYPPPHGGISTHVRNLQAFLEGQGDEVVVIDTGRQRWTARLGGLPISGGWDLFWKVLTQARHAEVVHIHAGFDNTVSRVLAVACWVFVALAGRRLCTIFTIHSGKAAEYFQSLRGLLRWFFRNIFDWTPVVITVNAAIRNTVKKLGGATDKRLPVIPAFSIDQRFLLAKIPASLVALIEKADPLVSCAIFLEPGYGADDVLELSFRLKDDYPRHLFVVMGTGKDEDLIRKKLNEMGLENNVLLAGNLPQEVCLRVMSKSRLFLRPTRFDGDSNSVREALALGIPVVATRTDFRPEGVLLYLPGDVAVLEKTVREVLERPYSSSPADRQAHVADWDENLRQIRAIYTEISNR